MALNQLARHGERGNDVAAGAAAGDENAKIRNRLRLQNSESVLLSLEWLAPQMSRG